MHHWLRPLTPPELPRVRDIDLDAAMDDTLTKQANMIRSRRRQLTNYKQNLLSQMKAVDALLVEDTRTFERIDTERKNRHDERADLAM